MSIPAFKKQVLIAQPPLMRGTLAPDAGVLDYNEANGYRNEAISSAARTASLPTAADNVAITGGETRDFGVDTGDVLRFAVPWFDLPGNDINLSLEGEVLDDTVFGNKGFRSKIIGIKDWTISGTAVFSIEDPAAQILRRSMFSNENPVIKVRYLPGGVNFAGGLDAYSRISNFSHTGSVGDLEMFEVTLESDGQLVETPAPTDRTTVDATMEDDNTVPNTGDRTYWNAAGVFETGRGYV